MGTHPIFESDFDCLTDRRWRLTRNSARSLSWPRSKSRTDQCPTGSATVLETPSSTTPSAATGAVPRLVCKLLADQSEKSIRDHRGSDFLSLCVLFCPF